MTIQAYTELVLESMPSTFLMTTKVRLLPGVIAAIVFDFAIANATAYLRVFAQ